MENNISSEYIEFHIYGRNSVRSAKIEIVFQVLFQQKHSVQRPLVSGINIYMQNILKFKAGFSLCSFQKEFSFEEKGDGANKEIDVSLLGNTPKGKYRILLTIIF